LLHARKRPVANEQLNKYFVEYRNWNMFDSGRLIRQLS